MESMISSPTPDDRKLVAQRVTGALALDALEPSRKFAGEFRRLGKKITFGRSSSPAGLWSIVVTLCVYGKVVNAVDASKELESIDPDTWDIDYSYVQSCIFLSHYFAYAAGDDEAVAVFQRFLVRPDHYWPTDRVMSGGLLKLPFEQESHPEYLGGLELNLFSQAIVDISMLARMWTFGGSDEWSRDRIEEQIDTTIAGIHSLKGYEPW